VFIGTIISNIRRVRVKNLILLWQNERAYLLPLFLFLGTSVLLLCLFTREQIHLAVDAHHAPVLDYLFFLITMLGNGWAPTLAVLILLFVRFRYAMLMAVSNIAGALVTQSIKHTIFSDALRPVAYFRGTHALHLVPGVEMYSYNSFPSGHAATACASCFCLAVMTQRRELKALLGVLAVAIAFSRVYLSEHFLVDVIGGAVIGLVVCTATFFLLQRRRAGPGHWLDRSILKPG
jgi:membrane-associated phospholipid phosphatase